jgi:hypothetical protein
MGQAARGRARSDLDLLDEAVFPVEAEHHQLICLA